MHFCPREKCPHFDKATKYPRKCYYGEPQCWKGWLDCYYGEPQCWKGWLDLFIALISFRFSKEYREGKRKG